MQGDRAATAYDIHSAARRDIDASFLAGIGGVRRGETDDEARRKQQSACCDAKLHGRLLPPHPLRVTNGRSPSDTPFLFARTHPATALARMRHWDRFWSLAPHQRYKRLRRAGWLHKRAALPATAAKPG